MYAWDIHQEYRAPVIHGDHGAGEYHELNSEPFHGDVAHGDLHFSPPIEGHLAPMHHITGHEHEHAAPVHHDVETYHTKETYFEAHHEQPKRYPAHE